MPSQHPHVSKGSARVCSAGTGRKHVKIFRVRISNVAADPSAEVFTFQGASGFVSDFFAGKFDQAFSIIWWLAAEWWAS
jgi:hypothetical protein